MDILKIRYEEARHLVGASQGGVSENMEKLPLQGNNMEKIQVRINSWAEIHEEKWRHVPKKLKEKIQKKSLDIGELFSSFSLISPLSLIFR